jgi:hypothetical protein
MASIEGEVALTEGSDVYVLLAVISTFRLHREVRYEITPSNGDESVKGIWTVGGEGISVD